VPCHNLDALLYDLLKPLALVSIKENTKVNGKIYSSSKNRSLREFFEKIKLKLNQSKSWIKVKFKLYKIGKMKFRTRLKQKLVSNWIKVKSRWKLNQNETCIN